MIRSLALVALLATTAFAADSKEACPAAACAAVETAAIPAAAKAALDKAVAGAAATYSTCTVDGKTVYCAKVKAADGSETAHAVTAEGAVVACPVSAGTSAAKAEKVAGGCAGCAH